MGQSYPEGDKLAAIIDWANRHRHKPFHACQIVIGNTLQRHPLVAQHGMTMNEARAEAEVKGAYRCSATPIPSERGHALVTLEPGPTPHQAPASRRADHSGGVATRIGVTRIVIEQQLFAQRFAPPGMPGRVSRSVKTSREVEPVAQS